MPGEHALLSPSAAKRWLTCAPSARVESQLPERETVYAREGTIAHAVAACLLGYYYTCSQPIAVYDNPWEHYLEFCLSYPELRELEAQAAKEGFDFREILETVHDGYVSIVWSDYVRAKAEDDTAKLLVEVRVDLSDFVPESFGSSDAILIWGNQMHVYDLKYGRGVRVSARSNPQMMLYALGAYLGVGEVYAVESIRMTIVQPRLHAVSSDSIANDVLLTWAEDELAPAARRAYAGEGPFVPGDHCEFCKAKATCVALSEYTRRIVRTGGEPEAMTAEDIAQVLPSLDVIEGWIAAVRAKAMELLEHDVEVPGWKLVEGRATRKIFKEAEARKVLQQAGFSPADYDKVSLRSITDLQRLVGGAKTFNAILGDLVERVPGKPSLAPADDPRSSYNPAASAEASFGELL